jgi:hypothetical protein
MNAPTDPDSRHVLAVWFPGPTPTGAGHGLAFDASVI